jgi:hypothetical protein
MKRLGMLRIEREIEIIGLDIAELGGMTDEIYQKIKIEYGRTLIMAPEINNASKGLELDLDNEAAHLKKKD